jgi:hypothetical protein
MNSGMLAAMKHAPLLFLVVITGGSQAKATPVTLEITPGGKFDVAYQLSTGPSTAAKLNITGNVLVDLEITDGALSRFLFAGGNVAYSDTTSDITVSTFPVAAKVRLLTRGIVASMTSNGTAGAIDPLTGVISNTGHRLVQDRGTVTTRYIVANTTVQEDIRNLVNEPDSSPLVGVTTVSTTVLSNLHYKTLYRIDFAHTRDETRVQPAEVVSGTVSIREVGGFTASIEAWLPGSAFVTWSLTNRGQRPRSFIDRSEATGQPLVMLYAFAATDGPWAPPVFFDLESRQVRLDLPDSGLLAPVRLEYSNSLVDGEWMPLSRTNGATSVFNVGESGPVAMNLPDGGKGFVRLALAD